MENEYLLIQGDFTSLYNNLSYIINKFRKKYYSFDDHTYESLVGLAFTESVKRFNSELGKFATLFYRVLESTLIKQLDYLHRKGRDTLVESLNAPVPNSDNGEEFQDLLESDFNLEEHVLLKLDINRLNLVINFIDEELRDVVILRTMGYSQSQVADKLGLHQVKVLRIENRAYNELRFWMEDGMDAIKQYKVLADLGLSRQEIADKLGIAPNTVSRYKQRLANYNKAINSRAVMNGERTITHYIGELARYEKRPTGLLVKGLDSDEFILNPDKLKEFISEFEDAIKILD